MPTIRVNGATLYYEETGAGPETLVFTHGLLMNGRMFDAQVAALSDRYRCVTFDFRGQGQSEVTRDGYDMDALTLDAAALIEALGYAPCHFAGLSMGGFVGMRLAARHPHLLRSLILLDTSAEPEPNAVRYRLFEVMARVLGVSAVVDRVMPLLFGQTFLSDPTRATERVQWRTRIAANDRRGAMRAAEGVITRRPVTGEITAITHPTLIVVGDQDVATVPQRAQRIQALIPGSRLMVIPDAGHSSTIEAPEAVTAAIEAFLTAL